MHFMKVPFQHCVARLTKLAGNLPFSPISILTVLKYRLTYLFILLPGGFKVHVSVLALMQGQALSGNSRAEK
jgi:hypothetical protein